MPHLGHLHGQVGINHAVPVPDLLAVKAVALAYGVTGAVGEQRGLGLVVAGLASEIERIGALEGERVLRIDGRVVERSVFIDIRQRIGNRLGAALVGVGKRQRGRYRADCRS
jgi:hypothetical protein